MKASIIIFYLSIAFIIYCIIRLYTVNKEFFRGGGGRRIGGRGGYWRGGWRPGWRGRNYWGYPLGGLGLGYGANYFYDDYYPYYINYPYSQQPIIIVEQKKEEEKKEDEKPWYYWLYGN